ncbi:MAG: hypothetical protein JW908_00420 [Anaerolineales bacterium]|nr:hypothetical protein [Anaerolineales bacterium]
METNTTNLTPKSPPVRLGVRNIDHLYDYLVNYKRLHDGNSPSIRDIRLHFNISSTSYVNHLLHRLESDGKIRLDAYPKPCSIEIVGGRWIAPEKVEI